jgi:hypothetical protein
MAPVHVAAASHGTCLTKKATLISRVRFGVAALVTIVASTAAAGFSSTTTFRASYDGTFTVVAGALAFTGTGAGTHLGSGTVDGSSILVPKAPTAACQLPRLAFDLQNDSVTLTSANGDSLFFANSGTDCFDPVTGIIVADATYRIVGGTGRFEGASGSGTVTTVATCANPQCTSGTFQDLDFDGTITIAER